jgi:ABC-2 type transport system ATP-binding protein
MALLEVDGLTRDFRTRAETIRALDDVSFTVGQGEIVGLLGLNGAGKTTTLKVISTLLLPTSGTVRVDGYDVVGETRAVRQRVSVVLGGERGFYNRLSGRDNGRFFGVLSGLHRREAGRLADEALERVGLAEAAARPVETYSKGMKQRLHLAVGLLTTPRLLLLDEPTVGLDPIEAQRVRDSIAELRGTGVAIVLTSHYLADIERLAQRVVILQRGRVTHDLPLEQLLARAGSAAEIGLSGLGPAPSVEDVERAAERAGIRLLAAQAADGHSAAGAGWTVRFEVKSWTPDSLRALATLWPDREITEVRVQPASLEAVFSELARAEEGLR